MENCDWCGAVFDGPLSLLHHIKAEHVPRTEAAAPAPGAPPPAAPRKAVVPRAGPSAPARVLPRKVVPHARQVAPAASAVQDVSVFKCDVCAKIFKWKQSLVRHLKEVHIEKRQVDCSVCRKTLSCKRTLTAHMKSAHTASATKMLSCSACGGRFRRLSNLQQHLSRARCGTRRSMIRQTGPKCIKCKKLFGSVISAIKHKRLFHKKLVRKFKCPLCRKVSLGKKASLLHNSVCTLKKRQKEKFRAKKSLVIKSRHDVSSPEMFEMGNDNIENELKEWETEVLMEGNAFSHVLKIRSNLDLQLTLIKVQPQLLLLLQRDLSLLGQIKFFASAHIRIQPDGHEAHADSNIRYMNSGKPKLAFRADELREQLDLVLGEILNQFDKAVDEGSHILFDSVDCVHLRVAKYAAFGASSYIPLPPKFDHPTKGLLNIKNFNDNKCFLWCILAATDLPANRADYVESYYGRENEVDMTGITYPVKVKDIDRFERNNPEISVSVFALENEAQIVPLRVTRENRVKHVPLLLLQGGDDGEGWGDGSDGEEEEDDEDNHYVLIRDISRFLSSSTTRNKRLFWCENCLTAKDNDDDYIKHREICLQFDSQRLKMPVEGENIIKFTDYDKQSYHDYLIVCDFESALIKHSTCFPSPEQSSSTIVSSHVASGFCYVIIGPDGFPIKPPVVYHGEVDVAKQFLIALKQEETEIMMLRGPDYPLSMTAESEARFQAATECYLCGRALPREGVKKCRDHRHEQEYDNYAGAACQFPCNLNRKRKNFIPVYFHALTHYDASLIFSAIGELMTDESEVTCIPRSKEKYISFSWGNLRFLDSLNLLPSSLEKLVQEVRREDMQILAWEYPNPAQRELLCRKQVYCYEYFDDFDKFEQEELPPQEAFFNLLKNESLSDEDYAHAKLIFKEFGMKNLWDFHDFYLKNDVLILCDVILNFRKMGMDTFKLDIAHFYTTPGFTWSAGLLYTQQKIELLTDIDMHLMFERGMRGGVATINHRHAVSNNPYVPETYDETKEREYIMYLDCNNQYGTALSRSMPTGNFKFLNQEEILEFDILKVMPDDETGYLLDVDLEYDASLHDMHNDLCLAPEHVTTDYNDLSALQKQLVEIFGLPKKSTKKLVPNLRDKKRYIVYGTTLKLYVELGMKVTTINQILSFNQSPWIEPYISFNTDMRKQATSEFSKKFYKNMINSFYGKALERLRDRRNVLLTKNVRKFLKWVKSPLFHSFTNFDHGLIAVEKRKATVHLLRPSYLGQIVLDISKEILYSFHYKVMKARYGDKLKVCGTDTDSLLYCIKTHDVYEDMKSMSDWFDTSDYPVDHPLYSVKNKKVLGKFKDEMNSRAIKAFVGLRAKMYSFELSEGQQKCVGKGIPKTAQAQLSFKDYENCLLNLKQKNVSFYKIGTDRKHHLFTTFATKRGLCCYDDKRFILADNVNTLAYGHYKISHDEAMDEESE